MSIPRSGEHGIKHRGERGDPIAEKEAQISDPIVKVHQQVPGLLGYPGAGRICSHPNDMHSSGSELEEEQH